jgi:hypothetical protein
LYIESAPLQNLPGGVTDGRPKKQTPLEAGFVWMKPA